MCGFKPGEEVVCVAVSPLYLIAALPSPVVGSVYVVSKVVLCEWGRTGGEVFGLDFVELPQGKSEYLYLPSDFRKVVRRNMAVWLAAENTVEGPVRKREKVG